MTKQIVFATVKHEGQTRKDDTPYIYHPLTVAIQLKSKGYNTDYQIAGLFHDLLEDTDATEEEILSLSNKKVLAAVKLLTKTQNTILSEYIDNILNNDIAMAVKNEDRIHNLQEAHLAPKAFIEKYLKETKEYYLGKFSTELDEAYYALKAYHEENYSR